MIDEEVIIVEPLHEGYAPNQILAVFQNPDGNVHYTSMWTDREILELLNELSNYLHRKIHG